MIVDTELVTDSITCLSGLSRWCGALGPAVVCWGFRDRVPPHGLYLMAEQWMDGATLPADVRPPQSRALGGRRVLWPFNCVAVLLSPSLSNYGMICLLNLKIWIMLRWVVQELPRGVFTQQLLLEWRATLLGTRRCCVLCSLNNNTLAGLFFTATLFEALVLHTCCDYYMQQRWPWVHFNKGAQLWMQWMDSLCGGRSLKEKQTSLWSPPPSPSGCWSWGFFGPHHGFLDSPVILTLHFPYWLREYFYTISLKSFCFEGLQWCRYHALCSQIGFFLKSGPPVLNWTVPPSGHMAVDAGEVDPTTGPDIVACLSGYTLVTKWLKTSVVKLKVQYLSPKY